jgi:hypothetical protein
MAEQTNAQNNGQNEVQIFFNSSGGLILFGAVAVVGLVCSGLGALDAIVKYKFPLIICGIILFSVGIILVVRYAIKAYKQNTTWKAQNSKWEEQINLLEGKMNEIQNLLEKSDSLIELATKGMKITHDFITIDFDDKDQLYYLDFEKRFIITSSLSPIRYESQFYANKFLKNPKATKEFYGLPENKINWKDLKVEATIQYKQPKDKNYTPEKKLTIINQIDGGNIMPFDIYMKTSGGLIPLQKGTEIILKYSYRIERKFWGTYLNRTIGFFAPQTKINISYNEKFDDLECHVYHLAHEGNPILFDEIATINPPKKKAGKKEIEIEIPTESFVRYRVTWDAKKCFGGDEKDTENSVDELGVTKR